MGRNSSSRALLIILDGFGIGKDTAFNAVKHAKMPFYAELARNNPACKLTTHGQAVGLPEGVMGNSEVGHTTLGAGRVIFQDLTRISRTIHDKSFFDNKVIREAIETGAKKTGRVHFMGLLSDGGVHSHIDHLCALLDFCVQLKVPNVSIHAFMDGRDTPPNSGIGYMKQLLKHPCFAPNGHQGTKAVIATIEGRYWAMDRDKRWERVTKAYAAMTGQIEKFRGTPEQAIESSYASGKTDEFIEPVLLDPAAAMKDGDSAFFFNFRSDRAREISEALTATDFDKFDRGNAPKLSAYAGMSQYENAQKFPAAFLPQNLDHIFGEWLEEHGLSQFRIAETEKYAHVTFFFNGGREKPFEREDRVLIASPKDVPTYDLKPGMSAMEVAANAEQRINQAKYDFVLINFANPDMVGHTGNYDAVINALEILDQCLAKVVRAAVKQGYHVLVTADHGNAEEMRDENGQIHTQHTLNQVPAIWVAPENAELPKNTRRALHDGGLQDVMPTLCDLMGLPLPKEVTGKSLIEKN